MKTGIPNAKVRSKRCGRKPLSPVIIKKVIETYEQAPGLSVRDIARLVDVSPASVARIRKGYQAGIYDRDGFRYEKPLVCI